MKKLINGLLKLAVVAVVAFGAYSWYQNPYAVVDWWKLRSYQPPPEIKALADELKLTDKGRKIFYVSNPKIDDKQAFNQDCPFPERSLVLGCYSNGNIFILKVDDPRLNGVEEVTAAHEILHAAYARLNPNQKEQVDALVVSAYNELNDPRIEELVQTYAKDDPNSLNNELHSILGTESRELPSELEDHYAQYFQDRLYIVAKAESYEAVFTEIMEKIEKYDQQINNLKAQISNIENELSKLAAELNAEAKELTNLRQGGNIEEYNSRVPSYNAKVQKYNQMVDEYKALIAEHNKLVEDRNKLASVQNELIQSLDSKFQPIGN